MRYGTEAIALMNTDRPDASDALEDDQWLASALVDWEVVRSGPITRDDLEELRRLRAMLRRLTVVIASGRQLSNEELSDLNRLLARTPTFSHVEACDEGYILDMTPVAADWRDVADQRDRRFFRRDVAGRPDPPTDLRPRRVRVGLLG
jgi:hypothetical protein